jgi:hypothetical protein
MNHYIRETHTHTHAYAKAHFETVKIIIYIYIYIYIYQFSLRHFDLLNYRKDIFKTNIFIQLMIQYGWSSSLISLTSSQKIVLDRNLILKNDSAASSGILGTLTYFT